MTESIAATRRLLAETFPKCFMPKGAEKPPVKIGIHQDILARLPDLDPGALARALADYTKGDTYRRNLRLGRARIDLDGNPSGTVSILGPSHWQRRARRMAALLAVAVSGNVPSSWVREANEAIAAYHRAVKKAARGIEARRAETAQQAPSQDESPVVESDAP